MVEMLRGMPGALDAVQGRWHAGQASAPSTVAQAQLATLEAEACSMRDAMRVERRAQSDALKAMLLQAEAAGRLAAGEAEARRRAAEAEAGALRSGNAQAQAELAEARAALAEVRREAEALRREAAGAQRTHAQLAHEVAAAEVRLRDTQASLREAGGRLAAERDSLRGLTDLTKQSALGAARQRLSTSVLASHELNLRFAALSTATATQAAGLRPTASPLPAAAAASASTPATAAKGTPHYAALLALAEQVVERHLPREDNGGSGALQQQGGAARLLRRGGILLKWSALGPAPFYFWIEPHGPAAEGRAAGPHLAWRVPGAAPSCREAQSVPLAALQLSPGGAAWGRELLGATPPGLVAGSGFAVRASAGSGGAGGQGVGTLLLLARDGAQRTAWLQVLQQQARAARAAGGGSPGAGDRLVGERVARARAAAGSGRTVAHSFGAQLQRAGQADELTT